MPRRLTLRQVRARPPAGPNLFWHTQTSIFEPVANLQSSARVRSKTGAYRPALGAPLVVVNMCVGGLGCRWLGDAAALPLRLPAVTLGRDHHVPARRTALRWRFVADDGALRSIALCRLGCWGRSRRGRPRRKWEDPLVKAAGLGWLADLSTGRAEAIAQRIVENGQLAKPGVWTR